MSRRSVLWGAAGLTAGATLSACTSDAQNLTSPSGTLGGKPVRGGTLRVADISGGSSENLFPGTAVLGGDIVRTTQLYMPLFFAGSGDALYPLEPALATEAEPNSDATVWTIRLRDGVTWHNGKDFSSDDVVYNLQNWMADPSTSYGGGMLSGLIDFANVKAMDKLTVRVPLHRADSQLVSRFTNFNLFITPAGMTPEDLNRHPIGTGPFKFKSFAPGKHSVFVRNENFWDSPKPYFDELVVDTSFTDSNAVQNALLAGAIDVAGGLEFAQAAQLRSNPKVQVLESTVAVAQSTITMRVDQGPFADVRVRQAFKHLIDRQQMIDGALAGFGQVGNDLTGPGAQFYATDLEREYDPDKARSLFKAAGVLGETFELPTTPLVSLDKAAAIFAQQAKAAGVNVKLRTVSPSMYWTPTEQIFVRPFSQDYDFPHTSLNSAYSTRLIRDAPMNATWWGYQEPDGRASNDRILQAMGTVDETKAAEMWHDIQEEQFEQGGLISWVNLPWVDVVSPRLRGLKESGGLNLNTVRFADAWFAE